MCDLIRPCEYDNYPIPAYDPTIPSDERKRLIVEADAALEATIEEILKKYQMKQGTVPCFTKE